ncbi:MAG: hypothetical protein ABIC36_02470 [bacterium]
MQILDHKILEEKNIIDDNFLDIVGNEFKFDHEKGLSEWLKNSVDAYIRASIPDKDQFIFFRFIDGVKDNASFECVDFIGMTKNDIIKAFKRWGDPKAAKRGFKKIVYGGHGNGGKFYMRQMFNHSHFVTYKNGYLNIFGFNEKKKYGFVQGFKNKKMAPKKALNLSGINKIAIPLKIKNKILASEIGFTVIKGIGPLEMKNKVKIEKILEKFKSHPQSRNILSRIKVSIIYNNKLVCELLRPDKIKSMNGFELPKIISIPEVIKVGKQSTILANKKYPLGRLTLRVSEMAFEKNSRFEGLGRMDFIGKIGVIASYRIYELNVKNFPQAAFIYGECSCPILESPERCAVKNDRTKLIDNNITRILLQWISEQIDNLAAEIANKEEKEREKIKTEISSVYNNFLNQWKNKFMKKLLIDVIGKGVDVNGGATGKIIKKILEIPDNLEFSYSLVKIPVNVEYPITLKALISKFIPIGSIISFSSDNSFIEIKEDRINIKNEDTKKVDNEQKVAVININVIGKRVGEKGKIKAKLGRINVNIEIEVIEDKGTGTNRKSSFPKVLLSGIDPDPLGIAPGNKVILNSRQPVVYQRPYDTKEGIYWINTSSPLAQAIYKRYGTNSLRWRDYLLQRYIDVFIKEALFEKQKKDPDSFRAERIDADILGTLISKIHERAAQDLDEFLFKESYEPSKETKTNI